MNERYESPCYFGVVTKVSPDGRRAQVKLGLLQVTTGMLRIAHPVGLVIALSRGDEVLVFPTGGGLEDGAVVGWFPTALEMEDARKVVVSDDGSLPKSTEPGSPIANASVTGVKVRLSEVQ